MNEEKITFKKIIIFTVFVALTVISAILEYGLATGGFLISALMLIEIHFSLREDVHYFSPQRSYYKRIGRLDKFKKVCIAHFIVFAILGIMGFILELFNIIQ